MRRPYIRDSANDLLTKARANASDPAVLIEISKELEIRSSERAARVLGEVRRLIRNSKPTRIFTNETWEKSDELIFLGDYHPLGRHKLFGGTRENYDKHSGLILDLKSNQGSAIAHFMEILDKLISPGVTLTYVPSHDATKKTSGVRQLVRLLAGRQSRQDATDCILRTKTITKLTRGGNRSIDVQLDSLAVIHGERLRGCPVLIIDDVTTSGNSLEACKRLFIREGAAKVRVLALGRTV